jgi:hypothetical protein
VADIVPAEQVEKEARVMLYMAQNIRDGAIRAIRDEHGVIRYQIIEAGCKKVEAMRQWLT